MSSSWTCARRCRACPYDSATPEDLVKALALGAKAVMIGRAYLWGMAASGERGVTNVPEILRQDISETLLGLSKASVHDLSPEDIIVPDGFAVDQDAERGGCGNHRQTAT
ncbi:MAG: alpha-hydroxy-acid oxidizing protein [Streptosporangiaceae bacterium]|jgi:hypothetical protein